MTSIDAHSPLEALTEFLTRYPAEGIPTAPTAEIYTALRQLAYRHSMPGAQSVQPQESGTAVDYIRQLASGVPREQRSGFYFEAARLVRKMHLEVPGVADFRAIDQALTHLEDCLPLSEWVTELHYFAGLNEQELADVLQISRMTVAQELRFTRAWLISQLRKLE